ncbi:MAG: hypothetical protein ABR595_02090 [Psychroflexus sp.]
MLKINKFFIFFFLINFGLFSQDNKTQEFIGAISLEDKTVISYKLTFKDVGKGKIEGQSITDFSGDHRTVSKITGHINYDDNSISFKEIQNLSTKSDYEADSFCFIHLNEAKVKLRNRKSIIEGHFTGKFPDGEDCVSGEIKLIGSDFFFKRMDKLNRKISRVKKIDSITKKNLATSTFKKKLDANLLEKNDVIALFMENEPNLYLEIWDEELQDGDRIDVYINKSLILDDYEIKNDKKTIKIPFDSEKISITIIANNIGEKAPNTVSLNLRDSQNTHKIRTKLEENEQAYIMVKKE